MPATADVTAFGCLYSLVTFSIFSTVPIVVIWFLYYIATNYRRKALTDQLNHFCEGWLSIPRQRPQGRIVSWPRTETTFNGHPLRITIRQTGGKHKVTSSRFELELPSTNGFDFAITNQDVLSNIGRLTGMQDVAIGDEVFDNKFVVKTNSDDRVREILNEEIRGSLIERLTGTGDSLKVEQNKIVYETVGEFQDIRFNDHFFQMMILAERIADRLAGGTGDVPDSLLQPQRLTQPQKRQTFSGAIGAIAQQWPEDEDYLKRLSSRLYGGYFKSGDTATYTYRKGRNVLLEYFHKSNPKALRINIAVTQKFWLRLIPQTGPKNPDEILVGEPSFDQNFRIHTDQSHQAMRFLNSAEVSKEINSLPAFERLEIYKGNLELTIRSPRDSGFLHSSFEKTMVHLNQIIELYENQKLNLQVSPLQTVTNTCPYCREDLDLQKESILVCNLCHTPHHETCLSENKQCTTWGCLATEKDFSLKISENQRASGEEFETN